MKDTFLIDLEEPLVIFSQRMVVISKKHQIEVFTAPMIMEVVELIFDDILNERLAWVGRTRQCEHHFDRNYRWFQENCGNEVSTDVVNALDELEYEIEEELLKVIPRKTWQVWTFKLLIDTTVSLKLEFDGLDYRIHSYNLAEKERLHHEKRTKPFFVRPI